MSEITPKQMQKFAERMTKISVMHDTEEAHVDADALLCEVLSKLGYGKLVEIYQSVNKWYA